MRRRPALYLLTSLVALATGMALLGTAWTVGAPWVADPRSVATEGAAFAFYAAITETIRTGDPAALDAVAAAELVVHSPLASLGPGRAGLEHYLGALHATAPDVEITVEEVVASGDRALVHLAVRGGSEEDVLGIPRRSHPPVWGTVEALRVAGRHVVELWPGATDLALLEPLAQETIEAPGDARPVVELTRVTIPPHERFEAAGMDETRLLYVEAGAVAMTIEPRSPPSAAPDAPTASKVQPFLPPSTPTTSATLATGDLYTVPQWSQTALHNGGSTEARVLVTTLWPSAVYGPSAEWRYDPAFASNEASQRTDAPGQTSSAGSVVVPVTMPAKTELPSERLVVALGRMTLAPGTTLPAYLSTGPQLLVVERGVLGLDAEGEQAWVRQGATAWTSLLTLDPLALGDGALLHARSLVTLRGAGDEPVTVLVVAILPDDRV